MRTDTGGVVFGAKYVAKSTRVSVALRLRARWMSSGDVLNVVPGP
jgi:hypothetical protein